MSPSRRPSPTPTVGVTQVVRAGVAVVVTAALTLSACDGGPAGDDAAPAPAPPGSSTHSSAPAQPSPGGPPESSTHSSAPAQPSPGGSSALPPAPTPRGGTAVLGAVRADGTCDPAVIDLDRSQRTAVVRYISRAASTVTLRFLSTDGTAVDSGDLTVGSPGAGTMFSSEVPLTELASVAVAARATDGGAVTCTIPVR
ncbi:hypothetical protein QDW14_09640 [Corynebacterium bovis]|uniref:hypothetical protein n=1 Tax=Corynebacterium bovis TaxID=36808 RepID=UPI00244C02CF|nr:hypothetical protein [Corynebacterium bovis]MDH2456725.1 hypothetical protein [Corynebacterium bovis]